MPSHRVRVGINYKPANSRREKRAEPGDIVDDLPKKVADWMLRDGVIEKVGKTDSVWPDTRGDDD